MLPFLDSLFESLKELSNSPWFYAVIFTIALLDSVIPVVPSETLVIIGGVSAGLGDLFIPLVIVAAAGGAFIGDNMSYTIGTFFSERLRRHYGKSEKGRRRLQWAHDQIEERGGELLITARYIPGGRTIVTLTCGITNQHRSWFMPWAAVAASLWALYASLLGFVGGKTFSDNHTLAFLIAFAAAVGVTVVIEVVRSVRRRRAERDGDHAAGGDDHQR